MTTSGGIKGTFQRLDPGLHDKKGPNRLRISNFLITLNTNVAFKKDEEMSPYIDPLYEASENLFGNGDRLGTIIRFENGSGAWTGQYIERFEASARVEKGYNMRGLRLHLHVALKILHHSMIQVDRVKLKNEINRELEQLKYPFMIHHVDIKYKAPSPEDYLLL